MIFFADTKPVNMDSNPASVQPFVWGLMATDVETLEQVRFHFKFWDPLFLLSSDCCTCMTDKARI